MGRRGGVRGRTARLRAPCRCGGLRGPNRVFWWLIATHLALAGLGCGSGGESVAPPENAQPASAALAPEKPPGRAGTVLAKTEPPCLLEGDVTEIWQMPGAKHLFETGMRDTSGVTLEELVAAIRKQGDDVLAKGFVIIYDWQARGDEAEIERRLVQLAVERDFDLFSHIGEPKIQCAAHWLVRSSRTRHMPPDLKILVARLREAGFVGGKEGEAYGVYEKKMTFGEAVKLFGAEFGDRARRYGGGSGPPGGSAHAIVDLGPAVTCSIRGHDPTKSRFKNETDGVDVHVFIRSPEEVARHAWYANGVTMYEAEMALFGIGAEDISNRVTGIAKEELPDRPKLVSKTYVLPDQTWLGIVFSVHGKGYNSESFWLGPKGQNPPDKKSWEDTMKQVGEVRLDEHVKTK